MLPFPDSPLPGLQQPHPSGRGDDDASSSALAPALRPELPQRRQALPSPASPLRAQLQLRRHPPPSSPSLSRRAVHPPGGGGRPGARRSDEPPSALHSLTPPPYPSSSLQNK